MRRQSSAGDGLRVEERVDFALEAGLTAMGREISLGDRETGIAGNGELEDGWEPGTRNGEPVVRRPACVQVWRHTNGCMLPDWVQQHRETRR